MQRLIDDGMLLQSARGPLANAAELIAGEPIKGSWWGHPAGHTIFNTLNDLADSPDVVRLRLVKGKITLVHRRLWPALVRVADGFDAKQLAALDEVHTETGAHRVVEQPFPDWVPADVHHAAAQLTVQQAWSHLPTCLQRRA
jgi:hypothetical protein